MLLGLGAVGRVAEANGWGRHGWERWDSADGSCGEVKWRHARGDWWPSMT